MAKEINGRRPGKGERVANSGRKAGVANRKTREMLEVLAANDFNPAEALIYIYKEAQQIFEFRKKSKNLSGALTSLDRMSSAAEALCQYVYPKKKAIEHSGEVGVRTFADFIAAGDAAIEYPDED